MGKGLDEVSFDDRDERWRIAFEQSLK